MRQFQRTRAVGTMMGVAYAAIVAGIVWAASVAEAVPVVQTVTAENPNPGVLPPHSKAFGKTYGQWAAKWWQWAFSIPMDSNPLLDETGEFCDEGQHGKVWFLAGNFGGVTERTCHVPHGKALFFPIINAAFWVPEDGATEEAVRAGANAVIDGAADLEVTIDGRPLTDLLDYRAESPAFVLPGDELLVDLGFEPGDRYPTVADGYWVLLAPLSKGEHEIHFSAALPDFGFESDVTYHLKVGK